MRASIEAKRSHKKTAKDLQAMSPRRGKTSTEKRLQIFLERECCVKSKNKTRIFLWSIEIARTSAVKNKTWQADTQDPPWKGHYSMAITSDDGIHTSRLIRCGPSAVYTVRRIRSDGENELNSNKNAEPSNTSLKVKPPITGNQSTQG